MLRFLFDNIWWKAASVLLAVALWFTLILEPELVTSASVPIFFKNLPKGLEFASQAPDRIVLEIRGPESKLAPEALRDTAVQIDLASVTRSGERTFTIDRANLSLPFAVTFVRAVPSQLRLQFDRQLSKLAPVRIRHQDTTPAGWRIVRETASPDALQVIGPANKVDQVEYVETDPIDFEWAPGEKTVRVHVFAGDPQVRFESSPMVTVRVVVEKIP